MQFYQPRIHIALHGDEEICKNLEDWSDKIKQNNENIRSFMFPETKFITVTEYHSRKV